MRLLIPQRCEHFFIRGQFAIIYCHFICAQDGGDLVVGNGLATVFGRNAGLVRIGERHGRSRLEPPSGRAAHGLEEKLSD